MSTFDEQQAKLQAMLDQVTGTVKASAEAAEKEMKTLGKLTEETKAAADKALNAQGELHARMNVLEQMIAKGEEGTPMAARTAGQLVADADGIKDMLNKTANRVVVRLGATGLLNAVTPDVTTSGATGGSMVAPDRASGIRGKGICRLTIRDLLTKGRTTSNAVQFLRETAYNNAATGVRENPTNDKPTSTMATELVTEPVVTIAHMQRISKQALDDLLWLGGFIDNRMRRGLAVEEERQLLKGAGTAVELHGLYTQATAFARPSGAATATTLVDTLRLAILQAELECYFADGIVLGPIDRANLDLLKDNNAGYLLSNPFGGAIPTLWGRALTESKVFGAGEWLVGDFSGEAQLTDRQDATVEIFEQDRDNVARNLVTVRAEQREVLEVYQPAAFVKNAA